MSTMTKAMSETEKSDYRVARATTTCPEDHCKAVPGDWCGVAKHNWYQIHQSRLQLSAAQRLVDLGEETHRLALVALGS